MLDIWSIKAGIYRKCHITQVCQKERKTRVKKNKVLGIVGRASLQSELRPPLSLVSSLPSLWPPFSGQNNIPRPPQCKRYVDYLLKIQGIGNQNRWLLAALRRMCQKIIWRAAWGRETKRQDLLQIEQEMKKHKGDGSFWGKGSKKKEKNYIYSLFWRADTHPPPCRNWPYFLDLIFT